MKIQDLFEAKGTKAEAGYQPNPKNGQKCINCTMWRDPNKCTAVAGNIDPDGWCKWYAGGAYGKRGKKEGSIKTIREEVNINNKSGGVSNNSSIIDNKDGWGAVPNNQEVDYLGLRVTMTPKHFIDLAAPLDGEPSEKIAQHLEQGGTIGSPFLRIEIPESWENGDFSMPARVVGHEGRNRMAAIAKVFGNNPVETHLFFSQGLRNRHITDEFKKNLNRGLVKEKSKSIVQGPLFSLTENIKEDGRIVKGVNTTVDVGPNEIKTQSAKFGNKVDKDGNPPSLRTNGKVTDEKYTLSEWAAIQGGHTIEEMHKPYKLFDWNKY